MQTWLIYESSNRHKKTVFILLTSMLLNCLLIPILQSLHLNINTFPECHMIFYTLSSFLWVIIEPGCILVQLRRQMQQVSNALAFGFITT